ncbi:hypothetical protein [Spiroplasma endosymbiont of Nephrotoma flavescens]|uniref:hypothetical protein n=1 Tax=Spiroplasma endosymbiont of Nephrotoma flavescens TaxID=3066302 RepID=UPI00313C1AD2
MKKFCLIKTFSLLLILNPLFLDGCNALQMPFKNQQYDFCVFYLYQDKLLPVGDNYEQNHWINLEKGNKIVIKVDKDITLDEFVKNIEINDRARVSGFEGAIVNEVIEKILWEKSGDLYQSASFLTQDSWINNYPTTNKTRWDDILCHSNVFNPLGEILYQESKSKASYELWIQDWKEQNKCANNKAYNSKIWWDPTNEFGNILDTSKQKIIFEAFNENLSQRNDFMKIPLSLVLSGAFQIKKQLPKQFVLEINPQTLWREEQKAPLVHWGFYFILKNIKTVNNKKVTNYELQNLIPHISKLKYYHQTLEYLHSRNWISWNEQLALR